METFDKQHSLDTYFCTATSSIAIPSGISFHSIAMSRSLSIVRHTLDKLFSLKKNARSRIGAPAGRDGDNPGTGLKTADPGIFYVR